MAEQRSEMTQAEAADRIWKLVKSIDICMFVTWDGERQRARPLSARPDRAAHRIEFLVDESGAADVQIERFPKVTLAFADTSSHDYAVVTGEARVSDDRDRIAEIWSEADKAWWESAEDPAIRLITVTPEDGEVWTGPARIVAAAKMLRAAVTGKDADFGENRKVDAL